MEHYMMQISQTDLHLSYFLVICRYRRLKRVWRKRLIVLLNQIWASLRKTCDFWSLNSPAHCRHRWSNP